MKRPRNTYELQLVRLKEAALDMGRMVGQGLSWAVEALVEHDTKKAMQVIELDKEVDQRESELEFKILDLISLQQPSTMDLRALAATLRVGRELERFGDYAVNIAEAADYLAGTGEYFKPLRDIPRMAQTVGCQLSFSLEAFSKEDLRLAQKVLEQDDLVDNLFRALHDELIEYMKKGSRYVEQGSYFLLVARYLERMGDHAVNVAQMANFTVTGSRISKGYK